MTSADKNSDPISKNNSSEPTNTVEKPAWRARYFYMGRVNDSISAATVLMRFNFSSSLITCITSLNFASIRKIKEYNSLFENYEMEVSRDKISEPRYILHNQNNYHGYNVLMTLYMRFHEEDPNGTIDVNAMLKAWSIYHGLDHHIENLSINRFWYLCQYMHIKQVIDEEMDGGRMIYSREYKTFHYVSNNSRNSPTATSYIKLKNIKDILKLFNYELNIGRENNTDIPIKKEIA